MNQVLSYSSITPAQQGPGWVYPTVVTLNCIGLVVGVVLFFMEIDGDAYAPMIGIALGGPLVIAHLLAGTLPAWTHLGCSGSRMSKLQFRALLFLSIVPPLIDGTGIALSMMLPKTHGGSGC